MEIVNVKTLDHKDILNGKTIAYCGNNYEYWSTISPILKSLDDYSILGKPKECIVRGNRPLTISNYSKYLSGRLKSTYKEKFITALKELEQYDALACWCSPLQCHCEVIIKAIKYVNK